MKRTTWGVRKGTLYYVFGSFDGLPAIKIGMTTQPVTVRARQLRGRVLAARPGTGADETAAHAEFAASALGREWFSPTPELWAHVAAVGGITEEPNPQREVPRGWHTR